MCCWAAGTSCEQLSQLLPTCTQEALHFAGLYFNIFLFLPKISHLENALFVVKQYKSIWFITAEEGKSGKTLKKSSGLHYGKNSILGITRAGEE